MVEISKSGSGEGFGWATGRGYSTIAIIAMGQGFHFLEASSVLRAKGERNATCRGLSPWQVIQRITLELGRSLLLPTGASNKPKKRGGGMVIGKSDQLIVEV